MLILTLYLEFALQDQHYLLAALGPSPFIFIDLKEVYHIKKVYTFFIRYYFRAAVTSTHCGKESTRKPLNSYSSD